MAAQHLEDKVTRVLNWPTYLWQVITAVLYILFLNFQATLMLLISYMTYDYAIEARYSWHGKYRNLYVFILIETNNAILLCK